MMEPAEVKKKIARFDDKFTHKPEMKVDEAKKSVDVTYPYLETGKDEYVSNLNFNSAMTYWAEFTTTMFGKAPELQQVNYSGILNDQPVLKISTTRQQFDAKLSTVQETIASYSAITFAKLGLHKSDDKGARKDQEEHKTKTYKAALSFLPERALDAVEAERVAHGGSVPAADEPTGPLRLTHGGLVVAVACRRDAALRPEVVLADVTPP